MVMQRGSATARAHNRLRAGGPGVGGVVARKVVCVAGVRHTGYCRDALASPQPDPTPAVVDQKAGRTFILHSGAAHF